MAIDAASVVVAAIAARIPLMDAATQASLTIMVDEILKAVKHATVTVPGTGLVSPPGTAGGPVTGTSTTGALT